MIQADSSFTVAQDAKEVSTSVADVDLTTVFPDQAYCRGIYNGGSSAASIKLTTVGGHVVTYANVPAGGFVYGLFKLLWKVGTTATGMIAEK